MISFQIVTRSVTINFMSLYAFCRSTVSGVVHFFFFNFDVLACVFVGVFRVLVWVVLVLFSPLQTS